MSSPDIIIVLGAGNDTDGNLTDMAISRARGALREHRKRPGSKLLLTGGYGSFNRAEKPHAYYVAEYLLKQGVDREDILDYAVSAHTVEDAVLSRRILEAYPVGSICVVTSEAHIERTRLIFDHFFDPRKIAFVATPDALPPDQLQLFRDHEADRIETIRKQGGIIVDGKLILRRTEA